MLLGKGWELGSVAAEGNREGERGDRGKWDGAGKKCHFFIM
jgi:hypothetical protein